MYTNIHIHTCKHVCTHTHTHTHIPLTEFLKHSNIQLQLYAQVLVLWPLLLASKCTARGVALEQTHHEFLFTSRIHKGAVHSPRIHTQRVVRHSKYAHGERWLTSKLRTHPKHTYCKGPRTPNMHTPRDFLLSTHLQSDEAPTANTAAHCECKRNRGNRAEPRGAAR